MTISVVIPAYNVEQWIGEAIESALSQASAPHEIIVVDDGSTDLTGQVAVSYSSHVNLIRQDNHGPGGARRVGAAAATGDLIFFLDADDVLLPGAFERVHQAFNEFPEAAAVCPNYFLERTDGAEVVAWQDHPDHFVLGRKHLYSLMRRNWLSSVSAVRPEAWKRYAASGALRTCEDQALWFSILLAGLPIVTLGEPLARYRFQRVGNLTSQTLQMRRDRRTLFRQLIGTPRLSTRERVLAIYLWLRAMCGQWVIESGLGREGPRRRFRSVGGGGKRRAAKR